MKRWRKWLVPGFLRRLDDRLLANKPVVWRTRVHFVAFYAITGSILLFLAGLLIPISPKDPTVDPIMPIALLNESYFFVSFPLALIGVIYWWYHLYRYPTIRPKLKRTLVNVVFYSVGLFFLLGVFPVSYRWGNILQTAYGLMDYEDVKKIQEENYYAYGFCLPEESSLSQYSINVEELLREGKLGFDSLIRMEDELLSKRYIDANSLYPYRWDQSNLSDLSYQSDLSDLPDLLNLSDGSYLSYRSYLSDGSYLSYWSDRSYRSYWSDRSYLSYLSDRSDRSDRSYLSENVHALLAKYHHSYNDKYYGEYEIPIKIDTITFKDITFHLPRHVYQLEDLTRSVVHARLFLNEGVIWMYFLQGLPFCLMLALIALGIPFLSVKRFFAALGVVIFCYLFLVITAETLAPSVTFFNILVTIITVMILFLSLVLGVAVPFAMSKTNYFPNFLFHLNWIALPVMGPVVFLFLSNKLHLDVYGGIILALCLTLCSIFTILYPSVHYLPRSR